MLQKVTRHGFEFWEAPRNRGPVFEDVELEEKLREKAMIEEGKQKIIDFLEGHGGARGATRPTKYGKRREDPGDPRIWGDLVQFSDEEPVEVLEAMGIARDEETLVRRGVCEPDIADIQDRVMQMFGVTQQEFFEPNKRQEVALCRAVSMALCRTHTNRTMDEIALAHDRDAAAVCRAVKRASVLRETDSRFAAMLAQVEATIMSEYAKAA